MDILALISQCMFSNKITTLRFQVNLPSRIYKPKWIVKCRLLREMFERKKRSVTKPKPGLYNTTKNESYTQTLRF